MKKFIFILATLSLYLNSFSQDFIGWTSKELKDALAEKNPKEMEDMIYYTTEQFSQFYYLKNDTVTMHVIRFFDSKVIHQIKNQFDTKYQHIDGEDSTWMDTKNKLRIDLGLFLGKPTITVRKFGELSGRALLNK